MFNSTNSLGPALVQPLAPSGMSNGHRLPGLPVATNPAGPRMKARAQRRMKLTREDILAHRATKLNEQGRRAARLHEQEQARREQAEARNEARAEERARKRMAAQDQRLASNRPSAFAKSSQHSPEPRLRVRDDLSSRRSVLGPELQHDCNARLQEVAARYGLIVQVIDVRNGDVNGSANASANAGANQGIACTGERPLIIDADRAPALAALQELGVRPAALVDENEDSCRSLFPGSVAWECHQRGFIGVTGIETLIAELDPILRRHPSTWVFMSRFEVEDWLSRMRARAPQDAHLPAIRLSSDDALKERVTLAVNGVLLFGIAVAGCLYAFHRRANQPVDSSAGAVDQEQAWLQPNQPLGLEPKASADEVAQPIDPAPDAPTQIHETQGA